MKRTLVGLALLVGSFSLNAQEPQDSRIQVKEPSVVTVHGVQDPVEPARMRRKPGRFKLRGLKALTGAGNAAGWLLNSDDDIPSSRERVRRTNTYGTTKLSN